MMVRQLLDFLLEHGLTQDQMSQGVWLEPGGGLSTASYGAMQRGFRGAVAVEEGPLKCLMAVTAALEVCDRFEHMARKGILMLLQFALPPQQG